MHTIPSSKRNSRSSQSREGHQIDTSSIFRVRWCFCTNLPETGIPLCRSTTPQTATCYSDSSSDDKRHAQAKLSKTSKKQLENTTSPLAATNMALVRNGKRKTLVVHEHGRRRTQTQNCDVCKLCRDFRDPSSKYRLTWWDKGYEF